MNRRRLRREPNISKLDFTRGQVDGYEMKRLKDLYEARYSRTWEIDEPVDHIVDFFRILKKKARSILDVGCGAGRDSFFLAGEGFNLVGLDISSNALRLASERNQREKTQCTFVMGTFLHLPFSEGRFDAAFSNYAIENVSLEEIRKALGEMKRVVKKGGVMLITLHSPKHWRFGQGKEIANNEFLTFQMVKNRKVKIITHFFERAEAERLFEDMGLKLLSISEVLRIDEKQRAHWIATLENSQKA